MFQRFLKNTNGSILPIAMLLAPFIAMGLGFVFDYSRVLNHAGKLQSNTDLAVLAAMHGEKNSHSRALLAKNIIMANMPGADLKTRSRIVNGELVFQIRSKFKTPLMGVFGKPVHNVYASSPMPRGKYDKKGRFLPVKYSSDQLYELRRKMKRMIDATPPQYREHFRKEYEHYYENLRKRRING